jgi:hypothetical protein
VNEVCGTILPEFPPTYTRGPGASAQNFVNEFGTLRYPGMHRYLPWCHTRLPEHSSPYRNEGGNFGTRGTRVPKNECKLRWEPVVLFVGSYKVVAVSIALKVVIMMMVVEGRGGVRPYCVSPRVVGALGMRMFTGVPG